ncbi:hypothetical protein LWI29_027201 [Acer saccharum]|uniref:RNase H type-1 domain-containing protein n=1 Tax=Acer saccharum TaxID=4024 RepID=A0AA39S205_ACESA|nr:hypothetical protein LWI29_027201 [Acer saccharum]
MNGWSPPDDGAYKTNCRAVVDSNSGHVGMDIIVRNSARDVLACYSQMLEVNLSTKIAKLVAIQKGFQFGIECDLTPSKIETDNARVVKWINLGLHRDTDYGTLLLYIDVMNAETRGMSFSHISSLANKAALSLTKNELIIVEDRFWMEEYPGCIRRIVEAKKSG